MSLPKEYRDHLLKAWRIVATRYEEEDGETVLCVSFARGEDSLIHDRINLDRDSERLAEFEEAAGDGDGDELLDRRIGIVFDRRFGKSIIGYQPTFCPLTAFWPTDRQY